MFGFTRRILFASSILSLVLCVALGVMWVRSYSASETVTWTRIDGWRSIRSAAGHAVVSMNLADWSNQPPERFGVRYEKDRPSGPHWDLNFILLLCSDRTAKNFQWERAGFGVTRRTTSRGLICTVVAPFWSLTAATCVMPLGGVVVMFRARRRVKQGYCATCGYDLRASPERCPECGTPR